MTPYKAIYGKDPPTLRHYIANTITQEKVLNWSKKGRKFNITKGQLLHTRARMKKYVDLKRQDRSFKEGDSVYLKLQPYRQQLVVFMKNLKLSKR